MTRAAFLSLALFVCASAAAQMVELGAMHSGRVFDARQGSLRPIIGVPGSALIADAATGEFSAVWPSPDGRHAIAIKEGKTVLLDGIEPLNLTLLPSPAAVVWNNSGSVAALYSASHGLQCAGPAQAYPEYPLQFIAGELTALAVEDCGNIAFAKGQGVFLLKDGAVQSILDTPAAALVFSDSALYVAASDGIFEYAAGAVKRINGRASITALARTKAGHLLALSDRTLAVIDREGALVRELSLDQPATALLPLTGSLVLLNGLKENARAVTVLDTTGEPAVFFIPAANSGSL